jgi:ArsR family transcriptional regulator
MEEEAKLFLALADETRLRILNLLVHGEVCVNALTNILCESQPKISRHLAFLKKAGLVNSRREGKWIYYKMTEVNDEKLKAILDNLFAWLSNNEKIKKDYEKLLKMQSSFEKGLNKRNNICAQADMIKEKDKIELEVYLL